MFLEYLRSHYACLEDFGQSFDRLYCKELFNHLSACWIHLESESRNRSSSEKYFAEISPLRVSYDSKGCCQTHHTAEHTALEETVLRSSKSVLHSCSFFNFVVLVVTRLETEEWLQDKETPITVHLSCFHCTIRRAEISCPFKTNSSHWIQSHKNFSAAYPMVIRAVKNPLGSADFQKKCPDTL